MAQNNENTEQSCASVTLCSGGCGFFGNTQFDGMCSKCYKDALKRKQATNPPPQEPAGRSSPLSAAALSAAASSYLNAIGSNSASLSVPKISAAAVAAATSESRPSTSLSSKSSTETVTVDDHAATSTATASVSSPKPSEDNIAAGTSDTRPDTPTAQSETKTKKRNRCGSCKKKVGLTGFECRCGGLYCSMHRYSDKHDCQFDYKKEGEDLIRKNNPVVVGAKLQKI